MVPPIAAFGNVIAGGSPDHPPKHGSIRALFPLQAPAPVPAPEAPVRTFRPALIALAIGTAALLAACAAQAAGKPPPNTGNYCGEPGRCEGS